MYVRSLAVLILQDIAIAAVQDPGFAEPECRGMPARSRTFSTCLNADELHRMLEGRMAALCRELTKVHEEVRRDVKSRSRLEVQLFNRKPLGRQLAGDNGLEISTRRQRPEAEHV